MFIIVIGVHSRVVMCTLSSLNLYPTFFSLVCPLEFLHAVVSVSRHLMDCECVRSVAQLPARVRGCCVITWVINEAGDHECGILYWHLELFLGDDDRGICATSAKKINESDSTWPTTPPHSVKPHFVSLTRHFPRRPANDAHSTGQSSGLDPIVKLQIFFPDSQYFWVRAFLRAESKQLVTCLPTALQLIVENVYRGLLRGQDTRVVNVQLLCALERPPSRW